MPFTLPDKGEPTSNIQAILFQEYLDALVAGIQGIDCVLSGLVVTTNSNMVPSVAKGAVLSNNAMFAVAAGTATVTAADATNPRIDLIVITNAGAIAVRAGTAAAAPKPPARSANDVVIAAVYVAPSDTVIAAGDLTDLRVFHSPPVLLKKVTSPVTINANATKQTLATITIPNGLFLSGKVIHCRMGGNLLANSGTPTLIFTIDYGGSTIFADITAASATSAVRHAWYLEFDLIAQANNDQALSGFIMIQQWATAVTAPTTGIAGEIGGTTAATGQIITSIAGAALAIDSDAADRILVVSSTFNVNNSADEIVMEYAMFTLEG